MEKNNQTLKENSDTLMIHLEDSLSPRTPVLIEDTREVRSLVWKLYSYTIINPVTVLCLWVEGLSGPCCIHWARCTHLDGFEVGVVQPCAESTHWSTMLPMSDPHQSHSECGCYVTVNVQGHTYIKVYHSEVQSKCSTDKCHPSVLQSSAIRM